MNRKAFAEESHQVLRKQQTSLEKLRGDNEALKTELAMQMRSHAKPSNLAVQRKEALKLRDETEQYAELIQQEKRSMDVTSEQVALMKQKIAHTRKNMGGVNAARENQAMIQKQVRILENRLDKALVKFNEALAHNKKLRDNIDDLRRERVVFDSIYKKLDKELHEKKRAMANIIELSNLSYEARDNFQMEIAAIEQTNRKEQDEFEEQMTTLDAILNKEMRDEDEASVEKSKRLGEDEGEEYLKKKVNKGAWGIAKEKVDVQVSVERVQNFEEAFLKIKAATGITDIEELVRTFIKNEDQNFSLFNYVNEQTNELEKMEELIQQLLEEEHKFAQESGEDAQRQKQVLQSLEAQVEGTKAGVKRFEDQCFKTHKTIGALKKGIGHMFSRVECDPGAMVFSSSNSADSSGFATAVTEANILQYLGIIEQRCNDVLQQYAACQQKERARLFANKGDLVGGDDEEGSDAVGAMSGTQAALSVLGAGPTTPMGQDLIHVNPPKLDDYSSDEEDDEEESDLRPLTRDELKAKALNRMNRRGGGGQSSGKKGRK
mmetsp:Transcript_61910/g.106372  ORF Transcript_61910/g.106372 Transcript_61910/m.106372 type:complete len:548 (+) Transcript_61910:1-1644(+)